MNSVDRNDPYPAVRDSGLDSVSRNDPYGSPPDGSQRQSHDVFYYFRFGGALLGVLVVLTGLYFAVLSFDVVRGIIESPQKLNSYLDEWYVPPKDVNQTPRTSEDSAEATEAETVPEPVPSAEAQAPEQPASASADAKPPEEATAGAAHEPPSAAKLKKLATRSAHHDAQQKPKDITTGPEFVQLLRDALTRGGLPRLVGAIVILLLVSMLIRIPFGLIKAGVGILRTSLPERRDT